MRNGIPIFCLAWLALSACSPSYSTGPIVLVPPSGEQLSPSAMKAVAAYAPAFSQSAGLSKGAQAVGANLFEADSAGFEAVARQWQKGRTPTDADPFLDGLLLAYKVGLLREYVFFNYDNPGWTLPFAEPLSLTDYILWHEANIVPGSPRDFVTVSDTGGARLNAAIRIVPSHPQLPLLIMVNSSAGNPATCKQYRGLLEEVAAQWPPDGGREGRAVSMDTPLAFFTWVESIADTAAAGPVPYLTSPAYALAVGALMVCDNLDKSRGGNAGRWLAMLKEMNPVLEEYVEGVPDQSQEAADAGRCPSPDTEVDLEMCEAVRSPNYGYSREEPMEVGSAAVGQRLWFGRLLCPGGAMPEVRRTGNVGPPPVQSSSAVSIDAPSWGGELLDRWEVTCPGSDQIVVLYSNLYRCGLLCPPKPFELISGAGFSIYRFTFDLLEGGDFQGALTLLESAEQADRDSEPFRALKAGILLRLGRTQDAREAFVALQTVNGSNLGYALDLAILDQLEGKSEVALKKLEDILSKISAGHPLYWETICRKGHALVNQGDVETGNSLILDACSHGFDPCCTK